MIRFLAAHPTADRLGIAHDPFDLAACQLGNLTLVGRSTGRRHAEDFLDVVRKAR